MRSLRPPLVAEIPDEDGVRFLGLKLVILTSFASFDVEGFL